MQAQAIITIAVASRFHGASLVAQLAVQGIVAEYRSGAVNVRCEADKLAEIGGDIEWAIKQIQEPAQAGKP